MSAEIAPDTGYGEVEWVRVTDPKLEPPRSWSIPAESMVSGLKKVADEDALGLDGRPAPPNYDYKPASGSKAASTSKES